MLAGIVLLGTLPAVYGCATPLLTAGAVISGIYGTAALGALAPTPASEISQVYYLGSFDPQGQIPPSIYRITVHGQASLFSSTKFASGWVPAMLIDPVGSEVRVSFDKDKGNLLLTSPTEEVKTPHLSGRRLVLYGPEGFRESPQDARLIIVMGADPSALFAAFDKVQADLISKLKTKLIETPK